MLKGLKYKTIERKRCQMNTTQWNIQYYLEKYEDIEQHYCAGFPFTLLHYAVVYRRFEKVEELLNSLKKKELETMIHAKGPAGYEAITPLVCMKWNLQYIFAYDEKNSRNLMDKIMPYLHEVDDIDVVMEYDNEVFEGKSVFDIFFGKKQPMLDVIYLERQKLASEQLKRNSISIAMDEVGTGKTVTGLYAIRNVIEDAAQNNRKAKILVVCPYNKREDWQSDVRRQLGRFAHVVDQGDMGELYENELKKIHFHGKEHAIIITGQMQSKEKKNGPHSALKGTLEEWSKKDSWDLVIIDEVHNSFYNYMGIRAKQALLLTATPIVVNASEHRTFVRYKQLLGYITGRNSNMYSIMPINHYEPNEEDIYVNWFREDIGKQAAERKIRFVTCKRDKKRDEIYEQIKEKAGALAALQYDQDDVYLFEKARELYQIKAPTLVKNYKQEELVRILKENSKSYIIFCEHTGVVDAIFETLKNTFHTDIIACKKGKVEDSIGTGNVANGQLINTLMQNLRQGKRVLFITTGKSGGTGLNLGEFDGVIHYELPFTSIELEQRFGRVDRMDSNRGSNEKDMIFLLNECGQDENDVQVNRMLYYCTTKIDITCKYMPVRNTVLYYPDFIKRNGKALRKSLTALTKDPVISREREEYYKEIRRTLRRKERNIRKMESWNYIEPHDESFFQICKRVVTEERKDEITERCYQNISDYLSYYEETKDKRNEYQRHYLHFMETKKKVDQWLGIVGLTSLKDESVFTGLKEMEDSNEGVVAEYDKGREEVATTEDEIADQSKKTIQDRIAERIAILDSIDISDLKLYGFSSEGIFCYKDGKIRRTSVYNYRQGKGWN